MTTQPSTATSIAAVKPRASTATSPHRDQSSATAAAAAVAASAAAAVRRATAQYRCTRQQANTQPVA